MKMQDIIMQELLEKKTMASFIYLIEKGREIEMNYKEQMLFVSKDGSKKFCSIWIDKAEQAFDSVEDLLLNAQISGQSLHEIWDSLAIGTIY